MRVEAPVAVVASAMGSVMKMGAWSACFGHQAGDNRSPRSAGFSRAQATLAR